MASNSFTIRSTTYGARVVMLTGDLTLNVSSPFIRSRRFAFLWWQWREGKHHTFDQSFFFYLSLKSIHKSNTISSSHSSSMIRRSKQMTLLMHLLAIFL